MKDLNQNIPQTISFTEWVVDIEKVNNTLTTVSFENRIQDGGRIYDLKDDIISYEEDIEGNRLYLHTNTEKHYYVNLENEGSIFGDIFVGEDHIDTFAMFDIND